MEQGAGRRTTSWSSSPGTRDAPTGSTTVAELEYLRDTGYPFLLQRLYRLEVMLSAYSGRSEENARKAKELLFGVQNSRKARDGGLAGLLDPAIMSQEESGRKAAARRRSPRTPS